MSDHADQPTRPAAFPPRMAWQLSPERESQAQQWWRTTITLTLSPNEQITVTRSGALRIYAAIRQQFPEVAAYFDGPGAEEEFGGRPV